jgi:hypothetical protein
MMMNMRTREEAAATGDCAADAVLLTRTTMLPPWNPSEFAVLEVPVTLCPCTAVVQVGGGAGGAGGGDAAEDKSGWKCMQQV